MDEPNIQLYQDLLTLYNTTTTAASSDALVLRRCADMLQLTAISDLTDESLALHEMVATSRGDPGEVIEKMSMLLRMIKDVVQTDMIAPSEDFGQASSDLGRSKSIKVPQDFQCPISLELMKDPVIVSTGQVVGSSCSIDCQILC